MSGPKTANYKLTPAQRRALVAQHEKQRRIGEASAYITNFTAKLKALGNVPAEADEQAKSLAEHTGTDSGYSELRKKLADGIADALNALEAAGNKDPGKMEKAVRAAKKALAKLSELRGKLDGIAAQNLRLLRQAVTDGADKASGADFSRIKTPEEERLEQLKQALSDRLSAIPAAFLSEELRNDIAAARERLEQIDSEDFLRNFSAMTVVSLEKRCMNYSRLRESEGEEYDLLLARYHALCEDRGCSPEEVPFEQGAVWRLNALVAEAEAALAQEEEQAYISRSIDEVMEDMGYRLVGNRSVVKKNGRRFRNELYSIGEGTAVNVTYSSNGNITMEIGGIDDTDRFPDAEETERLTEDMRDFCGQFREFERRLAEKGILSEHISLLPPEPEYAQIINISDYSMTEDIAPAEYREEAVKRNGEMSNE